MGLFSFLKKNRKEFPAVNARDNGQIATPGALLIKDRGVQEQSQLIHSNGEVYGIESIYAFLQADYESRGYNDALINPDESYRSDNIKLFRHDLTILTLKVKTYYEDLLKELDFHINSRSRAGLIDLVEILKTRKEVVDEHLKKVGQINDEITNNTGMTQRIELSYQRGFMRGLSAITQSKVLNKEY